MWNILDTGSASAQKNMAIDADLLEKLSPNDTPILRFYEWEKNSATYGYFLTPASLLNLEEVKRQGLDLGRRPTGGGLVFHLYDLAFSILMPACFPSFSTNTLDNYNFINSIVKRTVRIFFEPSQNVTLLLKEPTALDKACLHFCMAKPTQYDVMLGGRKVAGAAQRKRKQGYLHQGSIALALPKEEFLDAVLLPGTQVKEAMLKNTYPILRGDWTAIELQEVRHGLKHQLQKEFNENSC